MRELRNLYLVSCFPKSYLHNEDKTGLFMIIKRIISIILLITVLSTMVVGCKDKNGEDLTNQETPSVNNDVDGINNIDYIYIPEPIPFPVLPRGLPHFMISNITFFEDTVYFVSRVFDPFDLIEESTDDSWHHISSIFSMNPDGTNLQELPDYYMQPPLHEPGSVGGVSIIAFTADHDGNFWVYESVGFVGSEAPLEYVRKLSNTGAELLSLDVTAIVLVEGSYTNKFSVDKDGYIYLAYEDNIIVINSTDNSSFSLDRARANWAWQIIRLPDGTVAHYNGSATIQVVDTKNKAWGEEIELPSGTSNAVSGNDEFLIFFLNGSTLMGMSAETGEVEEFLNFSDLDVVFDLLTNLAILEDGRIMVVTRSDDNVRKLLSPYDLILLSKIPTHEYQERTELALFGYEIDALIKSAVVLFNETSKAYRIQITDYATFNQKEGDNTGFLKLSTELIAGNVPDILALSNLPYRQYAERGLLANLNEFFDNDPEMDKADMIESVMRAAQTDGTLYRVFPAFDISTLISRPDVSGSPGWTPGEFKAALDANPQADTPLGEWMTKDRFLNLVFLHNIEQFVDWDSGTVHFDSEEFIELLKLSDIFPLESDNDFHFPSIFADWEAIASGRQIATWLQFMGFSSYRISRTFFGGDITFKGFPGDNRKGSMFSLSGDVAITAQSQHKQVAWEFIRLLLSEDFGRDNISSIYRGFPVNRVLFDALLADNMNDGILEIVDPDNIETNRLAIPDISGEEASQIMTFIDSIDEILDRDEMLWNIISESAFDFFNGQTTASDAAKVIQSRASIYMSEQR